MTDNNNEKVKNDKNIIEKFEEILPQLWDKAKSNEIKLKSEYLTTLHTKLLKEIKTQISTPSFDTWFSGLSIEDLKDDNSIIFGTKTTMVKEWLEERYMSLIKKSLKTVTNIEFEVSFVLRTTEKSNRRNEDIDTIKQCVNCNCQDLTRKNIELPLGIQGIVSMTVEGLVCTNCGKEYYSDNIKRIIQLFKQREHERQIGQLEVTKAIPFHMMSEKDQKESIDALLED
ncbi:hypothetical protein LJK88_09885 [Paenibacillus sp. P26]|nr:hypothetical protein LJK88_09885 [Paenibacillus sp. P26]UUZ89837.1 hypothetical protein LJK87_27770 [Paenibacillus sp. P25]